MSSTAHGLNIYGNRPDAIRTRTARGNLVYARTGWLIDTDEQCTRGATTHLSTDDKASANMANVVHPAGAARSLRAESPR